MTAAGLDVAYAGRLLRRALLLWLPLRVLLLVGAVKLGLDPRPVPPGHLLFVAVAAVLCAVDARALRETVFQANLGTPAWVPAAAGATVAVLLELAIAVPYLVVPTLAP
jgi:hypothetical protein